VIKFILRRLIQAIPTFFGITILAYGIVWAAPGDPVTLLTAGNPRLTPEQKAILREQAGLNDPVYEQYVRWLIGNDWQEFDKVDRRGNPILDEEGNVIKEPGQNKGILRGDFGESISSGQPVWKIISEKIPATVELGGLALLLGFIIGIPIGILAAVFRGGTFDSVTRVMTVLFSAIPIFWLGLILMLIFGSQLGWLPMGGRFPAIHAITPDATTVTDRLEHLLLPVGVLASGWVAIFSRFMRASTLDILSQDYIRTARAKGLENRTVWFMHAARNALMPIATLVGPAIPSILGGAVVTETIFAWPGLGRTALLAAQQNDYPVIMGTVIIASIATIAGYLLSDLMYALIDPRIRLS
jgi:peptide/nickel transport system permease protein